MAGEPTVVKNVEQFGRKVHKGENRDTRLNARVTNLQKQGQKDMIKRGGGVTRSTSAQSSQSTRRTTTIAPPVREQLVKLQSLLGQGLISAAEAAAKRRDILAAM